MKTKITVAVVVCCLGLAGCVRNDAATGTGSAHLREVVLKDGTRCVLVNSFDGKSVALSCDWR